MYEAIAFEFVKIETRYQIIKSSWCSFGDILRAEKTRGNLIIFESLLIAFNAEHQFGLMAA